jgi:hypothetical protein
MTASLGGGGLAIRVWLASGADGGGGGGGARSDWRLVGVKVFFTPQPGQTKEKGLPNSTLSSGAFSFLLQYWHSICMGQKPINGR